MLSLGGQTFKKMKYPYIGGVGEKRGGGGLNGHYMSLSFCVYFLQLPESELRLWPY